MESFAKTERQKQAIELMAGPAQNCMLYGGSRSGKSFVALYALFIRACKTKSRHVCLRYKFNHIKTSLYMDTAPKVHKLCFPDCGAKFNKTDYFISFPNGSEIWFSGLDDKERTEKILGKEYSTIFFNECSQLDLNAINIAKTRLAEKNSLKKKIYYDQNPPSKRHWAYHVFEKYFDPLSEEHLNPLDYSKILMNPHDNIANIDENYLNMLKKLPERDKNRFLYGEYTDADEGQAYYMFNREDHVKEFETPPGSTWIGQDFNVDPGSAVLAKIADNKIWVYDEVWLRHSDTYKMADGIKSKVSGQVYIVPDSTAKNRKTSGKSDFHILREKFGSNAIINSKNPFVNDRVNNLNRLMEEKRLIIHPRVKKLVNDLEQVFWRGNDLDQKTSKLLTHSSDALGYLCWHLFPQTEVYDTDIIIS